MIGRRSDNRHNHHTYAGRALITGAGNGIGRALAQALDRRGQGLLLVDQDPDGLEGTSGLLSTRPTVRVGDVTDAEFTQATLQEAADALAAAYLVAGTIHVGRLASSPSHTTARVITTNLLAAANWAQGALPYLLQRPGTRLLFASSAFGLVPVDGYAAYAASKAGVAMLADVLSLETERRVSVHCALIGGVRTGIMQRGSYGPGTAAADLQRRFDSTVARTTPDTAAQTILRGADRGQHRILVGADARLTHVLHRASPAAVRAASRRVFGAMSADDDHPVAVDGRGS